MMTFLDGAIEEFMGQVLKLSLFLGKACVALEKFELRNLSELTMVLIIVELKSVKVIIERMPDNYLLVQDLLQLQKNL